jgi:hypothetical protein
VSAGRSFFTATDRPPGTAPEVASTLATPGLSFCHASKSPLRMTVASDRLSVIAVSPACGKRAYSMWRMSLNDSPPALSRPRAR